MSWRLMTHWARLPFCKMNRAVLEMSQAVGKSRAALIRSKNAGPFILTIDVVFAARSDLDDVVTSGVLDQAILSSIYGVAESNIKIHVYTAGLAIKIAMPRVVPSGDPEDGDIYGAQQHGPVAELMSTYETTRSKVPQ